MKKQQYGFEEYDDPNSLMSEKLNKVYRIFDSIDNHGGLTLLDVGCGNGANIDKLKGLFSYIVGIEPDKELLNECLNRFILDEKIDILPLSIEDMEMIDKKFDCITALDVIEHVDDPLKALIHIRNCINPHGTFVMTAPREFDLVWRILGKNPQHKTINSLNGWKKLIEQAGFKVEKYAYVRRKFGIGMCCILVSSPA